MRECMKKSFWILLCMGLLLPLLQWGQEAGAADKALLIEQARLMAISNDDEIKRHHNEIILKQMKYLESVEEGRAKYKNKSSFRYTPLLSFKFPEPFTMSETFEIEVEPLTLQVEVRTLQFELNDLRYKALAEANQNFLDVYISQETIAFEEEILESLKVELKRVEGRVLTGEATQNDVEVLQSSIESSESALAEMKTDFQKQKEALTETIGIDVTSGYVFRNPLEELDLPRTELESVVQYTLENDYMVYEANAQVSVAYLNLTSYETLMRNQYGGKMDIIQNYVNMAKLGMEVDYTAFQTAYDQFLINIDAPWDKSIRILFFTFTLEWFKGEISGSRYIEDDMRALYTACMEYENKVKDRDTMEKTVRGQVEEMYESVRKAYNGFESAETLAEEMRTSLDRIVALNQVGLATYDEVQDAQSSYQQSQMEALTALSDYNELLVEYDRMTCGAISAYLSGAGMGTDLGSGGDTFVNVDPILEPYYYIYTTVEDLAFHIGISIPEDYEKSITAFEIWNEGIQIGERTPIEEELRHLTLDYQGSNLLTVRLYDGDTYVEECEIDAMVARDRLSLGESEIVVPRRNLGSYKVETETRGELSTSVLTLDISSAVEAESFLIRYGEKEVYASEKIPLTDGFTYLTLVIESLDLVTLELYDEADELVYRAYFDTVTGSVIELFEGEEPQDMAE